MPRARNSHKVFARENCGGSSRRNWTAALTLTDLTWGTVLSAVAASVGYVAARALAANGSRFNFRNVTKMARPAFR